MVRNSENGVNKMVGAVKRKGLQTTSFRLEVLFFLEYWSIFCYFDALCVLCGGYYLFI